MKNFKYFNLAAAIFIFILMVIKINREPIPVWSVVIDIFLIALNLLAFFHSRWREKKEQKRIAEQEEIREPQRNISDLDI